MTRPDPYQHDDPHLSHALQAVKQEYGKCVHCHAFHAVKAMIEVEWEQPGRWRLLCAECNEWREGQCDDRPLAE